MGRISGCRRTAPESGPARGQLYPGRRPKPLATLTATDLIDAPGETTEEMPGCREPFSDPGATTRPVPETVFESISTDDLESTERDLHDPGSSDPDATHRYE